MNKEIKRMTTIIGNVKPFYVETIAEALYNAGYRKTFTSDFASDTQKAYKEGYIKGQLDALKQLKDDCSVFYGEYIPKIIDKYIEELEDEN